eukprot:2937064-Pyramimonas_sp.AAC.1
MTTRGRDGNAIIDALVVANENTANYDRYVLADTKALNDPTNTRHIGHHPHTWRNSIENEKFVGISEYAGRRLAKDTSSQSVCIVVMCRHGRHRSVAVSYGVKQFLKHHGVEYSSAHLTTST